jgi:hypothetical protein
MGLGALAVTAQIEGHTSQALMLDRMDPAGPAPVLMTVGRKSVDQQQRIDRAGAGVGVVDIKTVR